MHDDKGALGDAIIEIARFICIIAMVMCLTGAGAVVILLTH
jgi:hypothetical protein